MSARLTICPQCGATLYVDPRCVAPREYAVPYHVIGLPVPVRERVVRVVACPACEFIQEER